MMQGVSKSLAERLAALATGAVADWQFQTVPFGEWLPDQAARLNPGLVNAKNAISVTPSSYGPCPSMSAYGSALTARCQGAFTARAADGSIQMFAGDATKLYRLVSGTTTWEDVSRTVGGAYTVGADLQVRFAQFAERVISVNGSDVPQTYLIATDTDFSALAGSPPTAAYIAVVREFVFLARLSTDKHGVQWCKQGDPLTWPTPGSAAAAAVLSDARSFYGDLGEVTGVVGGMAGADVLVFQERGINRGEFTGDSRIFRFDLMEGARGSPAPGSIVQVGALAYYMSEDGFYVTDGASSTAISNQRVSSWFLERVDRLYLGNISGTADTFAPLVWWTFAGPNNSSGVPNLVIIFNYETKRWSYAEPGTVEYLFRGGTFGYTADSADGLGWDTDTAPFGPDSPFWVGYRPILSGFNSSHVLVYFQGTPLAAEFETGDLDLGSGRRVHIDGLRGLVDGGTITAAAGVRDAMDSTVSFAPDTSAATDAFCPQRLSARFARARVRVAAGGTWKHAQGVEARFRPEGYR
jgi:hypothetical protein